MHTRGQLKPQVGLVAATFGVLLVMTATPAVQERPLPNQELFLREVRARLQRDSSLQSSYSYVETRREQKLDKEGRVTGESVKVFENAPGLPGERRWERMISENGRPVPAATLAAQDRERQKKAEEYARRVAAEPRAVYAKQVRDWEKYRREVDEAVGDIFRVFDIRMLGREALDGHATVAFALSPRTDARPRTRDGGQMRHFAVRAWVSESDYELVKLEADAIDTLSIGWGLLARIHKGSRLTFERRKVNGEVWLPALATYAGSARVGLVKTIRRGGISEYSDYKKFTVDTTTTYASPAP